MSKNSAVNNSLNEKYTINLGRISTYKFEIMHKFFSENNFENCVFKENNTLRTGKWVVWLCLLTFRSGSVIYCLFLDNRI